MEREKADLEVELPDGTVARVVSKDEDGWIVERPDGTQETITPPGSTPTEKAASTLPRELGS